MTEPESERKKYLVIGGEVISRHDGQRHYVSAQQLVRLYGLNPSQCILVEEVDPSRAYGYRKGMVRLYPRYDGDYTLPTRKP